MDATDLAFAGATRQASLIAGGEVSSREVVEACLERIVRLDPELNAFRVVFAERALAEADAATAAAKTGDARPLLGVPVAIKDDVDVAGEITAWGTAASGPAPQHDAEVVRRLRSAGAIVIGKTSVPEMTIWGFTESKTWGITRNPWDLGRTTGGSSGGTGAAIASGMAGLGLGSDGMGSIRIPSAWCGLFGVKPQRGRVPLSPHDDAWQGLSVNGPIARTVVDAAVFLDVTGSDAPGDEFRSAARTPPGALRIAVSAKAPPGAMSRLGAEQRRALDETAELLRGLGHTVTERDPDYGPKAFMHAAARWFRGAHDDVSTMAHPERLERRTRNMARLGGLISDGRIAKIRAAEAGIAARVNSLFADHDLLLLPGPAGGPFRAGQLAKRGALWTANACGARLPYHAVFNATGQPAAAVPAGFDGNGVPLGVQIVGRAHDEATLLSLAAQIEAERPWADRRPPLS